MIIELEPVSAITGIMSGVIAFIKGKNKNKLCSEPCPSVQNILNEGTKRMDELVKVAHSTNNLTVAIAANMGLSVDSIKGELQDLMK